MGIWLAIKLFAGGAMKFIAANWKWVLPLILAIIAYFWVVDAISDARKEGYKSGFDAAEVQFKEQVAQENIRNRKFEDRLKVVLGGWGETIIKEASERNTKEITLKETLRETIKNNTVYEQCVADAQAIEIRNSIRKLGPVIND